MCIYANSAKGQDIIHSISIEGVLEKAALWASKKNEFSEWCGRTDVFGFLIVRHPDHEAAKTALTVYLESVCSMKELPRWVRRDIVFKATQHFIEPDIEEVHDFILNSGEYDETEAWPLTDQVQAYHEADEEKRQKMRGEFDQHILALLDGFYEKLAFYQANKAYIGELYVLGDLIECKKYGI